MRFLWITDPWDTLDHPNDTTLRLAREAAAQGHESTWCSVRAIRLENGKLKATDLRRIPAEEGAEPRAAAWPARGLAHFDSWQYRVDPPVDAGYLHPLQLLCLDRLAAKRLVNPPAALFGINEKLASGSLADLMPRGLVSSHKQTLLDFLRKHRAVVLKPLHLAQSRGIERLEASDPAAPSTIAASTDEYTKPVLLQEFLPGIAKGEQRLWFLDGKLLAHVTKHPLEGDFRVNIDQGSRLSVRALTAREKAAARRIGAELKRLRVRLAAVDLVDGRIIDFNVTSPGLLTKMERITGENLARPIVRALARAPRSS